jgi:predicted Zn-dependent peptidase
MKFLWLFAVLLFLAGPRAEDLVDVTERVLENGLKVLLVEDHNTPLVVCRLYYKVGSVNENIGKTGLSHMLEHMMFKGTKKIGVRDFTKEQALAARIDSLFSLSDQALEQNDSVAMNRFRTEAMALVEKRREHLKNNELWSLYQEAGGTALNAYTSNLLTAYIVTLPVNKLELFMWLEADRMANPVMREFYTERDVVMEERRLRYENSPYGRYFESLEAMIYETHPLRIPTIGYMSDLRHLSRDDAFNHFKTYYVPNNTVLVLVGDITEARVMPLVNRYFGPVPRGPREIKPVFTRDPKPAGMRRLIVKKDVAPVIDLFFRTPALGHADIFTLDIIEGVLSGKSGRLYKRLVKDLKLAVNVSAGNYISKYVSLFRVQAGLKKGVSHERVEQVIFEELEKLQKEKISFRELEKVKNRVTAAEINGLRSNETLADRLAYYEIMDSWQLINRFADAVRKVDRDAVQAAARTYFTEKNAVVGHLVNTAKGGEK